MVDCADAPNPVWVPCIHQRAVLERVRNRAARKQHRHHHGGHQDADQLKSPSFHGINRCRRMTRCHRIRRFCLAVTVIPLEGPSYFRAISADPYLRPSQMPLADKASVGGMCCLFAQPVSGARPDFCSGVCRRKGPPRWRSEAEGRRLSWLIRWNSRRAVRSSALARTVEPMLGQPAWRLRVHRHLGPGARTSGSDCRPWA